MNNRILLVFEGEKTEREIFENLRQYFFKEKSENTMLYATFNTDIYQLYKEMQADEYLDIISLLKEKSHNKSSLSDILPRDIAQIFLFFDYDGHAQKSSDNKITDLLNHFNEETENGKLYISYPMVEALKHLSSNINFSQSVVEAKRNIKYKQLVNNECNKSYQCLKELTKKHWAVLLTEHCKKMYYLISGKYILPTKFIPQLTIFEAQLKQYIQPNNQVAVLSAFPVFIIDYYGCLQLSNIIKDLATKGSHS
ncbi:hypothetical protein [Candidatus Venteria ishoeyi]|uniref:Uncharacterized protein n=2 Tax=Candidatus Venteria ishoeyi TaxID=1899563 RepID=A0A1H6FBZ1_9GAMM|nr:hypothetical protein [Candidatus Venteria ishoeyi]SEH07602.1 Uncharacterised protein [Candidatus Venteria ishoeyi]